MPQCIGAVTHYYPHVDAGVIALEAGELRVGDTIHVRGHTTDYYQRVDRLEVDHKTVQIARPGQSVGVHVTQRVREGDAVWKVSSG
jgi:putative protease